MKKNVMMRVASILLVAVLLTTCAISGTFAKYVATTTGTDSARVAKWNMQINGTSFNDATFTFNLFNTIKDSNLTADETDIVPADGQIIAPGTSGEFDLVISNASEVTAKFWFSFTSVETGGDIPIEYTLIPGSTTGDTFTPDDSEIVAWTSNVSALNKQDSKAVTIAVGGQTTYTVQWRWVINGDDDTDTTLGKVGTATVAVTAVLNAEQVD